jgi:hypothetical protein
MKTSLEIINKLSEKEAVKLDSQLVELALVDDANKAINNYFNSTNTANSKTVGAISLLRVALTEHEKSIKFGSELDAFLNKIKLTAKELGISPDAWKVYKDLQIALKDLNDTKANLVLIQKALSQLKAS